MPFWNSDVLRNGLRENPGAGIVGFDGGVFQPERITAIDPTPALPLQRGGS